eukprot:g2506.t1
MSQGAAKKAKTSPEPFPFDLSQYKQIKIDPWASEALDAATTAALQHNIQLCRDAIVFFTACGKANGYGGHTGGAFDTVPEVMILDAVFRGRPDKFVPVFFDEAGHRVATQYLMSVLRGHMPAERLRNYRVGHEKLPGHPELGMTPGVQFSSGRLGHMWPFVNGVAMANPDKVVVCLGSDGSQMEGNDAEAARLAVAQNLNVKLFIDDNDVTIAGHPSEYLKGYDLEATLKGHGMPCSTVDGEALQELWAAMRGALVGGGPRAVVAKRKMCPGMRGVEGTTGGHDAVATPAALEYFEARGGPAAAAAAAQLRAVGKTADPQSEFMGTGEKGSMRTVFGSTMAEVLGALEPAARKASVMVIDSDLAGSTGLKLIKAAVPDCYVMSGVMERGNFSAAAGFGMQAGKQGVFSTFAAFLEMCLSEITMARLNKSNVLCHFSHSGVDDMADNTCHFGINNLFADNGLDDDDTTRLYFPADAAQCKAVTERAFADGVGLRFVFTTRSKTPAVLAADGKPLYGEGYTFVPGKDEVVREGSAGYVVTYGDALYRALDAVERLRATGHDVGLINKPTLNVADEEGLARLGAAPFVLVAEPLSTKNGLGSKLGTWLLQRGLTPKYSVIGTHHEGCGGLWEHAYHQGYDSKSVQDKIKSML